MTRVAMHTQAPFARAATRQHRMESSFDIMNDAGQSLMAETRTTYMSFVTHGSQRVTNP
jgi:hypothetical protein